MGPWRVGALGCVAGLVLTACGGPSGRIASTVGLDGASDHVCDPRPGGRYGSPPISIEYTSDAGPGNEWTLPVGATAVTVHVTLAERPGTWIDRLWFAVAPARGAFPGSEVKVFDTAGSNLGPGEHTTTVTWDGTDDHGHRVKPGRYYLYAQSTGTTTNHVVTCVDGSRGVERLRGTEGGGIGYFRVAGTDRTGSRRR